MNSAVGENRPIVSSPPFRVEVAVDDDGTRVFVVPHGELDLLTVADVSAALRKADAVGVQDVVLDLRHLTFMDSTGIGLLVELESSARTADRSFAIIDGAPAVARILDIAGCADRFERYAA